MTSAWDLMMHQRAWMWRAGWTLFGMALLVSVASFWHPEVRSSATILALLAMQACSGASMLKRMADLQAAIDMKRIMLKAPLVTQNQRVKAGEPLDLVARDGTKFVVTPSVSVDIRVEYKG